MVRMLVLLIVTLLPPCILGHAFGHFNVWVPGWDDRNCEKPGWGYAEKVDGNRGCHTFTSSSASWQLHWKKHRGDRYPSKYGICEAQFWKQPQCPGSPFAVQKHVNTFDIIGKCHHAEEDGTVTGHGNLTGEPIDIWSMKIQCHKHWYGE
ncbi:hypothetical protein DOTSEDRAFT_29707 [Dothistroma septosporum NZE10]|uniref:Uncharacterized protein n=1 Tax=Dothistroma septosporum (strain NZE10 / CBS 128990) TaxID=675120 RepID=M2WHP5_DOTSN|nr:hypothetical protein DOTSEDRAFT_29707 [Dothistroma septosporum NZE10]